MPLFCLWKKNLSKSQQLRARKRSEWLAGLSLIHRLLSPTPVGPLGRVRITRTAFYDVWRTRGLFLSLHMEYKDRAPLPRQILFLEPGKTYAKEFQRRCCPIFFSLALSFFSSFSQKLLHWLHFPENTWFFFLKYPPFGRRDNWCRHMQLKQKFFWPHLITISCVTLKDWRGGM